MWVQGGRVSFNLHANLVEAEKYSSLQERYRAVDGHNHHSLRFLCFRFKQFVMQRSLQLVPSFGRRNRISKSSFCRCLSTTLPDKVDAMELFHTIDTDRSGHIDRNEYDAAVDRMSDTDVRKYSKMMFRALDANGDGSISSDEFKVSFGMLEPAELVALKKGLSRNELSKTSEKDFESDITDIPMTKVMLNRFFVSTEVMVSKIFPAGFGWQGGSLVAASMGLQATELPFFLMTGVGDALGVGLGHFFYMAAKNALGYKQDLTTQFHTSVMLSTACIFSGTAWQPVVNFFHGTAGLDFNSVALATTLCCTGAFFTGLRVARALWSPLLSGVAKASYANLKADALLSVAVGGATGAFVGTDVTFATTTGADGLATGVPVDSNWLRPIVGIEAEASQLQGMALAGSSTALGFAVVQTAENVVLARGKNWVD